METELTKREKEVLEEIAYGADVKECAENLFISPHTVSNHIQSIYDKTGVSNLNGISSWYFLQKLGISFQILPKRKKLIAKALIIIYLPMFIANNQNIWTARFNQRSGNRQYYNITA